MLELQIQIVLIEDSLEILEINRKTQDRQDLGNFELVPN